MLQTLACGLLIVAAGCAQRSAVPTSHSAFGQRQQQRDAVGAEQIEKTDSRTALAATSGEAHGEPEAAPVTSVPWRFDGADGVFIRTPNYRIYTTSRRSDFVHRLPVFYESLLEHYTSVFGRLPNPPEPLETFLFQSRSQWQAKTAELLPDQAAIFNSLGRGGYTTSGTAVLYYIDRRWSRSSPDTFAIAAHEGWHQYTQRTFKHHLPVWLEEGIATYMEGFSLGSDGSPQFRPSANRERRGALQEAIRRQDLIPLAELVRRSPQSFLESGKDRLLTYYAQVWALTRFLAEWQDGRYLEPLREVLNDAAEGRLTGRLSSSSAITSQRRRGIAATSRSGPWLILEYFNKDFDRFEEQYYDFIRTVAAHRGR